MWQKKYTSQFTINFILLGGWKIDSFLRTDILRKREFSLAGNLLSNGTHSHIHLSRMLLQTYLSHPLTKARQAARTFYVCLSTPFIFNQTYAMQLFPRMNKYIPFPHQLPPDWAISRAFILVMFKTSKLSRLKKNLFILWPTDHGPWTH